MAQREVQFETASSKLTDLSKKVLDQIVELMNRYPDFVLAMKGYTDNIGKASSNQRLSERRAKACYDYLQSKNIAEDRMEYEGVGEADPIGNNRTYAGRKKNRRVEFELYFPEELEEELENK